MVDAIYYVAKVDFINGERRIMIVNATEDLMKALMLFAFLSLAGEVAALIKIGETDEEAMEALKEALQEGYESEVK